MAFAFQLCQASIQLPRRQAIPGRRSAPTFPVFGDASHFASWSALRLGNCPSPKVKRKTRKGNHAIRYLLCEVANAARRIHSVFRSLYPSLAPRKGHKKAIIAVAHKRIRTIYSLFAPVAKRIAIPGLMTRRSGSESECPARQIQALKKYGYWPKLEPVNPSILAPAH
ncbi:MAG: transposase [Methylococcales bacterium]